MIGKANHLISSAGFRIVSFALPSRYDPFPMLRDERLIRAVQKMPWLERAAFAEHLSGNITMHTFFIVKAENSVKRPDQMDPSTVPWLRTFCPAQLVAKAVLTKDPELTSGASLVLPYSLSREAVSKIASLMDGAHTLGEIQTAIRKGSQDKYGLDPTSQVTLTMDLFKECLALSHLRRPASPQPPITEGQPFCKFDAFFNH